MDGWKGGWEPRGVDWGRGEWECVGVLEEAGGVGGDFEWVGELVYSL